MEKVRVAYLCDGKADWCDRRNCKLLGRGDCEHTEQRHHALYKNPNRRLKKAADGVYYEVR